jgi:hypothetical protein
VTANHAQETAPTGWSALLSGWRLAALLFFAALVLRLAFVGLEPPTRLVGDERVWVAAADEISAADVRFDPLRSRLIFYPPLHPYLIAAARELFGGLTGVKLAQSLLGALLVIPVFSIGCRTFDRSTAAAAAATAACYPELIWQSAHFWSEPLFMALLWASLALVLRADDRRSAAAAAGAGALLGLAALTRDPALYFAPVAAAWLALGRTEPSGATSPNATPVAARPARRRALGLAAAFLAAAVLVVAPWTLRNHVRFGAFIPVSLMGARTFWEANAGRHQDVIEEYGAIDREQGPLVAYRHAWREGLAAVQERQPWWIFEQAWRQLPQLATSANLVVIQLERQAYGPVAPPTAWAVLLVTALPHVLFTAAFLVGLVTLPRSRSRGLLLLFLIYYLAVHVATLGHPRLRLPLLPVVFVYAAAAYGQARDRGLSLTPLRRATALLLLLAFALCLLHDAAGFRGEPVFGLS